MSEQHNLLDGDDVAKLDETRLRWRGFEHVDNTEYSSDRTIAQYLYIYIYTSGGLYTPSVI